MKNVFRLIVLLIAGAALNACSSTLDGAGRDISKVGDKIQQTF